MRLIADRYSKALFELAVEAKQVEAVREGLGSLSETLSDANVLALFSSSKINPKLKRATLDDLLTKLTVPELLKTFARYLLHKSRIELLGLIEESYGELADKYLGNLKVSVDVARRLDQKLEQGLREKLSEASGCNVQMTFNEKPEIIGGLIIRIGSMVYDASLSSQVSNLYRHVVRGH